MFLAPDLILCALLATAALLPRRLTLRALPAAFAYTTGVLTTSVFSYASRGELGLPSLAGALTAATLTALLSRHTPPPPQTP